MKKCSVDMTMTNAEDPFNWSASSSPLLLDSHVTSVKKMAQQYSHTPTTAAGHHSYIHLDGTSLTIAQVASVARRKDAYSKVRLDVGSCKERVEMSSSYWVLNHVPTTQEEDSSSYGITTGSNARSKLHTHHSQELQHELIRFLNAGILSNNHHNKNSPGLNPNVLTPEVSRAAMLVKTNTLLQGFSGIRWLLLESMQKLINAGICVKLPLRGTITASGDVVPLSYIVGLLMGRPNSRAFGETGNEMSGQEALRLVGIEQPFDLLPEEATAMVSGTSVGSALASIVCYDANVLSLLAVVLSALFCEVMLGKPDFADPFVHSLKRHPGQIEAASIMEWILEGSSYMKASIKLDECGSFQCKATQDRYALRTSPQWLGPQIEVIRFATQLVEREINSVNDDPIIDMKRSKALHDVGNSQGTPIGVAMDHVRLALASIGKLMFAQFSELVNDFCSNGLTSNLSAGPNPSLDYGFKGAEIAMASYTSELQFLANPVTNHVQSAEQHNQDVNSLGLISARKTAEAIEVLKMMASTYMLALCQAVDLRHLEENLMEGVKETVCAAWEQVLTSSFCSEEDILGMLRSLPVFSYADDPMSPSYPFLERLRQVIVEHGLKEVGHKSEASHAMIEKVGKFEEELRQTLGPCLVNVRVAFDRGTCKIPNRIVKCRTYPIYEFVRNELDTKLLVGTQPRSPGQDIELLFDALSDGTFVHPLLNCLKGFPHLP